MAEADVVFLCEFVSNRDHMDGPGRDVREYVEADLKPAFRRSLIDGDKTAFLVMDERKEPFRLFRMGPEFKRHEVRFEICEDIRYQEFMAAGKLGLSLFGIAVSFRYCPFRNTDIPLLSKR